MTSNTKLFIGLVLAFVAGVVTVLLYTSNDKPAITSFAECVEAGYDVMESYPRQCATPSGQTFTEDIEQTPGADDDPVAERTISLYYYNQANDTDSAGNIQCSADGLVAVERTIPVSESPLQDAVRLLLAGDLTEDEMAAGMSTEFPLPGLTLEGVTVDDDDVLVLQFADPERATSGGSCRTNILWQQINATATQFDSVDEVRFAPEELFQP